MAAVPSVEQIIVEKPKRTRKSHAKVRTGCLTCKIRRKKCDETRPSCKRCTSTGRKCDGYLDILSSARSEPEPQAKFGLQTLPSSSSSTPRVEEIISTDGPATPPSLHHRLVSKPRTSSKAVRLLAPPSKPLFTTALDAHTFSFFANKTGPEFSGYLDSSFWQNFLITNCLTNSTIRAAAVALGAVHRRQELGLTPQAFQFCEYATRAYTGALAALRRDLKQGVEGAWEVGMISSMLFAAFETFQANYDAAAAHMTAGLKLIFSRKLKTISRASKRTPPVAVLSETNLRTLFTRLEERSGQLFRRPAFLTHEPNLHDALPLIPADFPDLESAYDALYTQIQWLLYALDHAPREAVSNRLPNIADHVLRLLQWSNSYATLSRRVRKVRTAMHERPFRFLRLCREVTYLLLLTHGDIDSCDVEIHPHLRSEMDVQLNSDEGMPLDMRLLMPWKTPVKRPPNYSRRAAMDSHFSKLLVQAESLVDVPCLMTGYNMGRMHSFSAASGSIEQSPSPPSEPNLYDDCCVSSFRSKIRPQAVSLRDSWMSVEKLSQQGTYSVAERMTAMEDDAVMACGALPRHLDAQWVDVTCFLEERKVLMRYCTPDREEGGLIWTQEWATYA